VIREPARVTERFRVYFRRPPPPVVGNLAPGGELPDDIELFQDLLLHGGAASRHVSRLVLVLHTVLSTSITYSTKY